MNDNDKTAATQPALNTPSNNAETHLDFSVEEREAYEYWGYLFKPDKTGTDKLKNLLRGLKDLMRVHYEPSDCNDLTPIQLAHFYRELDGNYDQLFLGTPSESIAFIYKSLGCLHSLQPLPQSTAFTNPTVPALKTEGWIMWQTIQILLGPEEHSGFLREAVQKWNITDPSTGEFFPKLLPRQCFPLEPDKHMVAWYHGVSERLRKEAEEEEQQRHVEAEQAEVRRIQYRKRREDADDNESVDSRGPAMAYFRNPLYRQDGRPTIVQRGGKRPQLSPRRSSMKDKAKEGATTMKEVIRNIGSPHLWDGRRGSKSESRDHSKDHRRRSSLPSDKFHQSADRSSMRADARTPSAHHRRVRSGQYGGSDTAPGDDGRNGDGVEGPPRHRHHDEDLEPTLRQSRSHEPTPSQKEITDYFQDYDDPNPQGTAITPNGIGPSFAPSASPLFASHVAKQPQPMYTARTAADYPPPRTSPEFRRNPGAGRPGSPRRDPRTSRDSPGPSPFRPRSRNNDRPRSGNNDRPRSSNNDRPRSTHNDRPRSRNNDRRSGEYDRRSGDRERRRYDSPRRPYDDNGGRASPRSGPSQQQQRDPPPLGNTTASRNSRRGSSDAPPYPTSNAGFFPPDSPLPNRERRRSGRVSGSDLSGGGYEGSGEGGAAAGPSAASGAAPAKGKKQTRFASGVDGRRYPDESSWR